MKNILIKLLLIVLGVLVIVVQIKDIGLNLVGKDAVAVIYDVDMKEGYDDDGNWEADLYRRYKFTVDEKEYTGLDEMHLNNNDRTKNNGMYVMNLLNSEGEKIKIKYLESKPDIYTIKTDSMFDLKVIGSFLVGFILIIIGILMKRKKVQ